MGVYNRNERHPSRPANWWLDYYVGAERIREPGCGRNKIATERLHAKRLREIREGTWKRPEIRGDKLSVAQYAERWSAIREAEGIKTQCDYDARLRDHVLPAIGNQLMADVQRADIKTLISALVAKGELAPRSVLHVYGATRSLFSRAIEDGVVVATPCTLKTRKGELPPKKDKNPRWRHTALYGLPEIERLISDERIPWNRRTFYALMFFLGARFGEAAGRQWMEWDEGARPLGRIVVATQYDGEELKSPQGDAPVRHVPVHPTLAALLVAWRDRGFALTYGRDPKPEDWIVPSLQGMGLRTVRNGLKRLKQDCTLIGIRERTQHDIRRTLYTTLREQGVDEKIASAITHGASVSDTASHYEVWRWPVLCEAVSRVPVGLPVHRSHIGHTLGLGAAEPPVFPGEQWRGGRDSKERPATKHDETAEQAEQPSRVNQAGFSPGSVTRPRPVTPLVTAIGTGDQAAKLVAAADVLRSGRIDRLTPGWRAELAQACDEAASALDQASRHEATAV